MAAQGIGKKEGSAAPGVGRAWHPRLAPHHARGNKAVGDKTGRKRRALLLLQNRCPWVPCQHETLWQGLGWLRDRLSHTPVTSARS